MKKKNTQMTLPLLETIVSLRRQGQTNSQISAATGISLHSVANYLRTIDRLTCGKEKLNGDNVKMDIINQYINQYINQTEGGAVAAMEKGVKMSPREVEKIAVLTGAGKSVDEISEEINRARTTVSAYITAIRAAMNGTFVHQSGSGVRYELIEPYIRKENKPTKIEKEIMTMEVQKANRPEMKLDPQGSPVLDAETTLLIAGEIDAKTPLDIITRLTRVDLPTVNKIKTYISFLRDRQNEQAIEWRKKGIMSPEAFDALEVQYNFFPREKTPEDLEADFRHNILINQELTNDLLNSIDDLLRKLVKVLEKE